MKITNRRIVLGAGLLGLSAALATSSFAAPGDNNDGRRDHRDNKDARPAARPDDRSNDRRPAPTADDHRQDQLRDKIFGNRRDDHRDNDRHDNDHHDNDHHDNDHHDNDHHDNDRNDRWDNHRDDHRGDNNRDDHRWDNDRDHRPDWNRPGWNNRPVPRPGNYGNGYGYGRPGYGGGYNGGYDGGFGNGNYSQSDFRQFTGRVVDSPGTGYFRVRADNGQYFNVRSNAYVRDGQRVTVGGYLYNGSIVNARVNVY